MADAPAAPLDKVAQPDQSLPVSSSFAVPTGNEPPRAPEESLGLKPAENKPVEQTQPPLDLPKPEERPEKPAPPTNPFTAPNGEQKKDEPAAAPPVMTGALPGDHKPANSLNLASIAPPRSDSTSSDQIVRDAVPRDAPAQPPASEAPFKPLVDHSDKPIINSQADEAPKAPPPTPAITNGNSAARDTEMTGTQDHPAAPPSVSAPAPASEPVVPAPAVASAPSQPPVAAPAPAPVEEIAAPVVGDKRKVDEAVAAPAVVPAPISANGEPASVQKVEATPNDAPVAKKQKTDTEPAAESASQIESQPETQPEIESAAPAVGDSKTNGGSLKKSNSRAKREKKPAPPVGRTARKTRSQGPIEG